MFADPLGIGVQLSGSSLDRRFAPSRDAAVLGRRHDARRVVATPTWASTLYKREFPPASPAERARPQTPHPERTRGPRRSRKGGMSLAAAVRRRAAEHGGRNEEALAHSGLRPRRAGLGRGPGQVAVGVEGSRSTRSHLEQSSSPTLSGRRPASPETPPRWRNSSVADCGGWRRTAGAAAGSRVAERRARKRDGLRGRLDGARSTCGALSRQGLTVCRGDSSGGGRGEPSAPATGGPGAA